MGAAPSRAPSRGVFTLLGRIGLVLVTALLLLSSRDAMRGYLRVQAPLRAATAVVEARIAEAHGQPVSVDDVRLPFAPTWAIPSEEHSYHVFHLMFGERIARPRTRGNAP